KLLIYFFQAEDGIRDFHVTGVQTCALPICSPASGVRRSWEIQATSSRREVSRARSRSRDSASLRLVDSSSRLRAASSAVAGPSRSEERRVGRVWSSGRYRLLVNI